MNATSASIERKPEIPGYRLERRLGAGGMAEVWLATQVSLERLVAVKILSTDGGITTDMAARFEREARVIAKLDHPHIVGIYDVGRMTDGRLFYSMPYLNNGDLGRRDLRYAPVEILRILRALLDALAYAHAQGVVHRDVKPQNVLFDKNQRPLLADFGIALARGEGVRVTSQRQTLGSTGYMSPEQARSGDVDGRADLYSLGVVAYEMLTGELPYRGSDALAVAIAHVEEPIPRLSPTLRAWQAFIDRALAKVPDLRFATAAEMRAALDQVEQVLAGIAEAPADAPAPNAARARPFNGRLVAYGLALIAAIVGAYAGVRWYQTREVVADTPPTASPDVRIVDAEALDTLLRDGYAALKRGATVLPEDDNAAQRFAEILRQAPAHTEARVGFDQTLEAAAQSSERAIAAGQGVQAAQWYDATYGAVQASGLRDYIGWASYAMRFEKAVEQALQGAIDRLDRGVLERLGPAFDRALMNSPGLEALRQRVAALPAAGSIVNDPSGARVALIPAVRDGSRIEHAFALGVTEVTRAEYAEFARATRRESARCRDNSGPIALLRRRDWENPGIDQGPTEPVICVSGDDARAYAAWLAKRSGLPYRLPTRAEWRHAAAGIGEQACKVGNLLDQRTERAFSMTSRYECDDGYVRTAPVGRFPANVFNLRDLAGNVSEWLGECAEDNCARRFVAGSSYRDGPDLPVLGAVQSREDDAASTSIGFRVARDLSF